MTIGHLIATLTSAQMALAPAFSVARPGRHQKIGCKYRARPRRFYDKAAPARDFRRR